MPAIWNNSLISTAKKVLKTHYELEDALVDIQKATGIKATVQSLSQVFKKFKEEPPKSFLKEKKQELSPKAALVKKIEAKEARKKHHKEGLTELILEKVEVALADIKPSTIKVVRELPPKTKPKGDPEVIWFEVSDVQLGTKVELEKMGGINEHNWKIFLRKLDNWKKGAKEIIAERRALVPIEAIVINFGGDIVDGLSIFKSQAWELDSDVYKQVMNGAEDFAQALIDICTSFPDLHFTVYGVGGNHGRVGAYGEAPYRANWDLVLYQLMKLRLEVAGIENVTCHFPESWFIIVKTWGWTHLITHGDDIKSWSGLPFYGIQKQTAKYQQLLKTIIEFTHVGHFHAPSIISHSAGEVLINGNFIGATSYAKQICEGGVPMQHVHGFTEENGRVWTKNLYLISRKESIPQVDVKEHGNKE